MRKMLWTSSRCAGAFPKPSQTRVFPSTELKTIYFTAGTLTCTYIYIRMHTHTHTRTHTQIHTYIQTYRHTDIHTYMYTCIHTCFFFLFLIYIYIHMAIIYIYTVYILLYANLVLRILWAFCRCAIAFELFCSLSFSNLHFIWPWTSHARTDMAQRKMSKASVCHMITWYAEMMGPQVIHHLLICFSRGSPAAGARGGNSIAGALRWLCLGLIRVSMSTLLTECFLKWMNMVTWDIQMSNAKAHEFPKVNRTISWSIIMEVDPR